MEKSEQPWLEVDEDVAEIIVGNREGLEILSAGLNEALEKGTCDLSSYLEDTNVSSVLLKGKKEYYDSFPEYKESIKDKIVGMILAIWFLVLPFVAIGFIGFSLF